MVGNATERFIKKARLIHGDIYDYSRVVYTHSHTKVIIRCNIHGEFLQSPTVHINNGSGCKKCANDHQSLTSDMFVEKANQVHDYKYDYSKSNYLGVRKKIIIICKTHGEFRQSPTDHIHSKTGCPKCSGKYQPSSEEFTIRAKDVHGGKYDYSLVDYKNNKTKIKIICPIHGIFEQLPSNHTYLKQGCPWCFGNGVSSANEFISRAREIHGNKYDYSKVSYENGAEKVIVICPIHGEFRPTPLKHIHGKTGCPMCAGKFQTTESFILNARRIHGDKYNYSEAEYKKSNTNVKIVCPTHGLFKQTPNNHISHKTGCPKCAESLQVQRYSKLSIEWLDTIAEREKIHIQHANNGGEFKIPRTNYRADGYCAETNTIYEFHGDCWHGNPMIYNPKDTCHPKDRNITAGELYQQTTERDNKIKSLGFNLIIVWESEWNNRITA